MEINQCINYLLTISQNKVFQYFSESLKELKITPAQYGVLSCLWKNTPQTPKQIGSTLYLEASSISGILDRMQKNELITREIDSTNRRNILIYPTAKANSLKADVERIVEELNSHFLSDLSHSEQEILKKLLLHIIDK
ncbi:MULTISPECIES: MarR family winged helix-turn-helix transcriptional regulator [unclassified Fusobacterium]|uniref:MarR family winged helix-turn-helix transcriptional regulator n=1 Tax=unclassified Fusobacterium TaxID=2648384 RepID=UPI0025C6E804|nr:MarR family transcriptional regulator [Fusobacterium sp.]